MTQPAQHLAGGCQCGAIRYEVAGPLFHRVLCHCTICRRTSAAPVVAWFTVAPEGFRLTQGRLASFRSSDVATRSFCGACGTPVTYRRDDLDEIDVTVCSLDDPEAVPPEDHTYARSALTWARMEDGLPRYETTRDA